MEQSKAKISLGFTPQQFEPGIHVCQIFNEDHERRDALVNFILSGIEAGENTACYTEKDSKTSLKELFAEKGISYDVIENSGKFILSKTADVYFANGEFDPDRMVELLEEFFQNSVTQHRTGARIIGEMTPEVQTIPGGNRLLEYESKVSLLLKKCPVNAVCQYDAREFDGSTIMDIMKVHPYMIIRGSVISNPFYVQPEEFLAKGL